MDRILEAGFKQPAGESVLIQSRALRTTDPAFRAAIEDVVSGVSALSVVQHVRSPLEPGNAGQIAKDGHAALVELQIRGDADKASEKIDAVVDRVDEVQQAHPQLFIGEFGNASAVSALDTVFAEDLEKAGLFSLPITLIILVVAFGALVAAGIPLLLALTAVFATFGLGAVVSQVMPLAEESGALVLLIGLAVGVDYSMFYLKREREERAAGRSERAAIEAAAATSGHSVLVSGLTVMVAMAGLFLTRDATFASFGLATMIVVAIAMLGSLTVLPGASLEARRPRRPASRAVRRPAPSRQQRRPNLGRGHRPRAPQAGAVRRPRRRAAGRARDPGAPAQAGDGGAGHVPAVAAGRRDIQPDAGGVPRDGAPRQRRRGGAGRQRPGRPRGDRGARAAGARDRPHARADHGRREPRRHRGERHDPDRGDRNRRRVDRGARPPPRTRSCRRRSGRSRTPSPASPE